MVEIAFKEMDNYLIGIEEKYKKTSYICTHSFQSFGRISYQVYIRISNFTLCVLFSFEIE